MYGMWGGRNVGQSELLCLWETWDWDMGRFSRIPACPIRTMLDGVGADGTGPGEGCCASHTEGKLSKDRNTHMEETMGSGLEEDSRGFLLLSSPEKPWAQAKLMRGTSLEIQWQSGLADRKRKKSQGGPADFWLGHLGRWWSWMIGKHTSTCGFRLCCRNEAQ